MPTNSVETHHLITKSNMYYRNKKVRKQMELFSETIRLCKRLALNKSSMHIIAESEIESTVNRKPNYAPFHGKLEFGSNVDV